MPYLHTVPPEEAVGEVKAIYDQDVANQGHVANFTRAFSDRPEVLQGWLALKDAITSRTDPRLYELATVAAATAISSSYCSLVHGQVLAASYYSAEQVISIAEDDAGTTLDAADAAVVRFARKVALQAEIDQPGRRRPAARPGVLRHGRVQHHRHRGGAMLLQQGARCHRHPARRCLA